MKFGPTVAVFRGEATLAFDHAARTCTIEGRGIDGRGASRALASGVVEGRAARRRPSSTIDGSFSVTGPLETFANAGGVHVARALLGEFSANMARLVAERRPARRQPAVGQTGRPAAVHTAIAACRRSRAERRQPHVARLPVVAAQPLRQKGDTEMSKLQVTDMLARAFAAEGVDTLFTLMGDANMYWSVAMSQLPGMQVVHARHEHCAVAMADGYARATGKVGVASTTCGPGFTQIMTALTIAARSQHAAGGVRGRFAARRLVVHPADRHGAARARPAARTTSACSTSTACSTTCARPSRWRRPSAARWCSSVPMDLQKQAWPHLTDYTPSSELVPMAQRPLPDPAMVERVVDMIAEAEKPIIWPAAAPSAPAPARRIEALAEQSGALLATSLLGKGLFDGNP